MQQHHAQTLLCTVTVRALCTAVTKPNIRNTNLKSAPSCPACVPAIFNAPLKSLSKGRLKNQHVIFSDIFTKGERCQGEITLIGVTKIVHTSFCKQTNNSGYFLSMIQLKVFLGVSTLFVKYFLFCPPGPSRTPMSSTFRIRE